MRRVLILTVTAGNGHNACAAAVKNMLETAGEAEVKVIDLLNTCSTKLNVWFADKGYNFAISKLPRIYGAFFNYYMGAPSERRYSCAGQGVAVSCVSGLLKEILSFKPDVIYCTHFYGAIALTDLRLAYNIPCKIISSVLDFVNSPFWEAGVGIDYLTLPHEDFIDEFLFEGFERKQLIPLGRPVDERTLSADRVSARKQSGIGENDFTVLVMFGGGNWNGGLKLFKNVIKAIKGTEATVIVINGKDKKSYKKISKMKFKNAKVINVGFTKDVPLYLAAADILVGKCGGGAATEAINAKVPMLVSEKVVAQEKYNLEYLEQKGVALSYANAKQLKEKLNYLRHNPEAIEKMKSNALAMKRFAVADLTNLILSQPEADYGNLKPESVDFNRVKKTVKHALKSADYRERRSAKYFNYNNE